MRRAKIELGDTEMYDFMHELRVRAEQNRAMARAKHSTDTERMEYRRRAFIIDGVVQQLGSGG